MNKPFIYDLNRTKRRKEAGVLIGIRQICRYCTIGPNTFYAWQRGHGFPASKLPDGRWSITKNLVDDWMVARWKAQQGGGHE